MRHKSVPGEGTGDTSRDEHPSCYTTALLEPKDKIRTTRSLKTSR